MTHVSADDEALAYSGRHEVTAPGQVSVGYSGARVRMRFEGDAITLRATSDTDQNFLKAWLDGEPLEKFQLDSAKGVYRLANSLGEGVHTLEVMRLTECFLGLVNFQGFEIAGEGARVLPWGDLEDRRIEFIGDSITCGYGVEVDDPLLSFEPSSENFSLNYSHLAARELGADFLVVARSGIGMTRNYDGPFEGSEGDMPDNYPNTFYENEEYTWDFSRYTPDVVCINLGTNDFSVGGVNVETYVNDYVAFASKALDRYPEAQLVVILGPMNNSEELKAALQRVVATLQESEPDRVNFIELSAQGELGYGADYHPNQAQSKVNAAELSAFLSDLMDWR